MDHAAKDDFDANRRRLLDAAIEIAGFEGWTASTVQAAEKEAGLADGMAALVFQGGVVDLLDFWALESDRAAEDAIAELDLSAMKVRERVAAGARARIDAIGDRRREAAGRAAARLALPDAAPRGARMLWRASDRIWRAIGDTSTDGNFYSKRAILTGVLGGTLTSWLAAEGPEDEAPWRFLDRRIDNVMQFERAKAQARRVLSRLPSPARAAAKLRYPRR